MNTRDRQEIFLSAWEIAKADGLSMSAALKAEWASFRLANAMRKDIEVFIYRKADGSERWATGTLQSDRLPAANGSGRTRKPNRTTQVYWDIEKHQFRSFRKANLIVAAI